MYIVQYTYRRSLLPGATKTVGESSTYILKDRQTCINPPQEKMCKGKFRLKLSHNITNWNIRNENLHMVSIEIENIHTASIKIDMQ